MGGVLPYHQTRGDLVLSLRYITPSQDRAQGVVSDLERRTPEGVQIETEVQRHEYNRNVYAVYAAQSHPEELPDGWERSLTRDDIVLADSVLNTFRGVQAEWAERGEPLNYYKKPEPRRISEAFDQVEWRQDVPLVGGELMSSLILKHALPNANHRTAIAYLRTYLQSVTETPEAEFEHAGNYEGDWHEWARNHVYESKRLLTLRRKTDLLRHAKKAGVETIQRKSGIEIDLSAHDFENGDVKALAEQGHRNRCIQFVVDLLERSGHTELKTRRDDGKEAFVARLS